MNLNLHLCAVNVSFPYSWKHRSYKIIRNPPVLKYFDPVKNIELGYFDLENISLSRGITEFNSN